VNSAKRESSNHRSYADCEKCILEQKAEGGYAYAGTLSDFTGIQEESQLFCRLPADFS
jgi:hypothetical protein